MSKQLTIEAITRRRVLWFAVAMLIAYGLTILLLGLGVGFDHGAAEWFIAGALTALAVGLTASVLLRLSVFVFDGRSRLWWWTQASLPTRVLRVGFLVLRAASVVLVLDVAIGALRR
jgi:energy-converting hydrogenase Eha subunit A